VLCMDLALAGVPLRQALLGLEHGRLGRHLHGQLWAGKKMPNKSVCWRYKMDITALGVNLLIESLGGDNAVSL
jgi:hypothetical protein